MTAEGILAIAFIVGAILLFHESGHFFVAKLCRMRVDEFGIGLPLRRPIVAFKRGHTIYSLNWIPFGAFVRIAGMDPEEQHVENGFHTRRLWQRGLVLTAGSGMNVVLATLLFLLAGMLFGEPIGRSTTIRRVMPGMPAAKTGLQRDDQIVAVNDCWTSTEVAQVKPGSPAALAGLRAGDRVTRVQRDEVREFGEMVRRLADAKAKAVSVVVEREDEADHSPSTDRLSLPPLREPAAVLAAAAHTPMPVSIEQLGATFRPLQWSTVTGIIHNAGSAELSVTVLRDGVQITKRMVPEIRRERAYDPETGEASMQRISLIGVTPVQLYRRLPPAEAVWNGFVTTFRTVEAVLEGLAQIILGVEKPEVVSIVKIAAAIQENTFLGWYWVLQLGGLVSFAIGFLNLLPFPPFDGWRIVYLGYEGVIGRAPDRKKEAIINLVGFVVVMFAFVILVLKDVADLMANRAVR